MKGYKRGGPYNHPPKNTGAREVRPDLVTWESTLMTSWGEPAESPWWASTGEGKVTVYWGKEHQVSNKVVVTWKWTHMCPYNIALQALEGHILSSLPGVLKNKKRHELCHWLSTFQQEICSGLSWILVHMFTPPVMGMDTNRIYWKYWYKNLSMQICMVGSMSLLLEFGNK